MATLLSMKHDSVIKTIDFDPRTVRRTFSVMEILIPPFRRACRALDEMIQIVLLRLSFVFGGRGVDFSGNEKVFPRLGVFDRDFSVRRLPG